MCGALKLSGIVRANVRLNIAIPMPFLSLTLHTKGLPNRTLLFLSELMSAITVLELPNRLFLELMGLGK